MGCDEADAGGGRFRGLVSQPPGKDVAGLVLPAVRLNLPSFPRQVVYNLLHGVALTSLLETNRHTNIDKDAQKQTQTQPGRSKHTYTDRRYFYRHASS